MLTFLFANIWFPAYGDPEDASMETPPETPPPPPAAPSTDTKGETGKKTFSQDELNKALADDRRRHQEQVKKAIAEVEALKSKSRLTQEERNELDQRIQQMQNELLSKEELAKKDRERLIKRSEEEKQALTKERDSWKDRFTGSAIRRAITDAAASNDAYSPSQIVALLHSETRLVEKLDDEGKPTGEFVPKVRFQDTDKDGKPITLELDPNDAVKRMKELENYQNLFKGSGVGGLGANNQPQGKKPDARNLAKDPEAYREARRTGKLNFS